MLPLGTSGDVPAQLPRVGGLGCDGMSSRGPMQPRHCLSGCKTLTRGQEGHGGDKKDTEGTAASCSIPRLCPIGGVAAGRGERAPHGAPCAAGVSPCWRQRWATLLPQVPQTSCHSPVPRRYHRRGWGCCPGERGERLQRTHRAAEPVISS